jgi:hypothetical protein
MIFRIPQRLVLRVLGAALVVGATAALLILFGLSADGRRGRPAGSAAATAQRLEALQALATATPSPTPIGLTPQQIDCLGFFGGVQGYEHANALQQQGMLRAIQNCVNGELGLPPKPAPAKSRAASEPAALAGVPTPIPLIPAGAGFIGSQGSAPTAAGQYSFANGWFEDNPSPGITDITVWAGAENVRDPQTGAIVDQSKGLVVVFANDTHGLVGSGPQYLPTPGKDGPVKVVAAVGETLALRAQDGAMFYFDVPSRQFVSALPVATATPGEGRGNRGETGAGSERVTATPGP